MARVTHYVTTKELDVIVVKGGHKTTKTLPANSFVVPISMEYLPKHILDDVKLYYYVEQIDIWVYCHYGIVVVAKNAVREV